MMFSRLDSGVSSSTQKRATISVAMVTYNGAKFVREQLDSIAAQTVVPDELIVVDDCSTDETVEILRDFTRVAPFPVHLHQNAENVGRLPKGITHNFEQAVGLCTGELIMLCDQDDLWLPQKVERMSAALLADPAASAVFCDAELINDVGELTGTRLAHANGFGPREQAALQSGNALTVAVNPTKAYGCTIMFRAELRQRIVPVPAHWWFDAWTTCAAIVFSRMLFVPEPLMHYRIHATQFGGAAVPTLANRFESWRRSAEEYLRTAEPQLNDILLRLQDEADPRFIATRNYLTGRLAFLRFRATLPTNRLRRTAVILPHTRDYFRFFNGWRSLLKDLTA